MESGNFSASTSSNLVTAFQTQNFKRQIDLLEQKLEINEREYQNKILSLTEQNSLLNSTEVKLRTQLSTKDKALYELNSILKEYQTEVINLKKALCLSEEKLATMTNDFNSIKSNCNNISIALNSKEDSQKKLEKAYNEVLAEQSRSENKIKELIDVMNQYSNELNILNEKCSKYERENFDFKTLNMNLTNELKKVTYENNNYDINIQNFKNDMDNLQKINLGLTEQNQKLKYEMDNYSNEIYETTQKLNTLAKENENLRNTILSLKNEKNKLESDLNTNIRINQKNIAKLSQTENETNTIINEANDNIKLIISWMDNYLGVYYSDNVKIPEVPLRATKTNRILFEQLKQKIQVIREKVNTELINVQNYKNKITNEIGSVNNKFDFIQKKVLEITNSIKFEIQKNNYFDVSTNFNDKDSTVLLLQDIVNQLLQFVYQDKLTRTNTNNQFECYKREINEYKVKNEALIKENQDISLKVAQLSQSASQYEGNIKYKNEYEKILNGYKLLEKKYKNLVTEMELKQIQIKSLEEIVSRRNTGGVQNNINSNENLGKIKQLELDKENLIKDNLILINENNSLKQKLNNMTTIQQKK